MRCAPSVDARRHSPSPTTSTRRRLLSWSPSSASCSKSPSPGLLSILAGLVASTCPADASPLSFLCPRAIPDQDAPATSSATRSHTKRTNKRKQRKPRLSPRRTSLPPKFAQGEDGIWRPVSTYALYGSTMCLSCTGMDDSALETSDDQDEDPVESDTAEDDVEVLPSSSTIISSPSPTSTANISTSSLPTELLSSLPKGWEPKVDDTPMDIIIAMSLVVAFVILFMIIGCMFWRKTLRHRRNRKDVEKKRMRRRLTDTEQLQVATLEKEIEKKQRLWDRAVQQWRANAHYTARKRRNRRGLTSSPPMSTRDNTAASSAVSLHDSHREPRSPSRSRSRRSSHSSVSSQRSDYIIPPLTEPTPQASAGPEDDNRDEDVDELTSPPAYHRRRFPQVSGAQTSGSDMKPSASGSQSPPPPVETTDELDIYSPATHSAHVATDDKGRLARLAEQASAPPAASSDPSFATLSVPLLEDVEHSAEDLREIPNHTQPSSPAEPLFPPPPSKGKMPAYFDFELEEDMYATDADLGPSAPPFEAHEAAGALAASAPPVDDSAALAESNASAPPLEEEEADASHADTATAVAEDAEEDQHPSESHARDRTLNAVPTPLVLPTYTP